MHCSWIGTSTCYNVGFDWEKQTTVHTIGRQWKCIYETKKFWNSGKINK